MVGNVESFPGAIGNIESKNEAKDVPVIWPSPKGKEIERYQNDLLAHSKHQRDIDMLGDSLLSLQKASAYREIAGKTLEPEEQEELTFLGQKQAYKMEQSKIVLGRISAFEEKHGKKYRNNSGAPSSGGHA